MAQLSVYDERLLIAQDNQLLITSPEGVVQTRIEMLPGTVQAAAPVGEEIALAVDNRVVITQKGCRQWWELMKGFGSIEDLLIWDQSLVIADGRNHRLVGYDTKEERPFKLAGSGEESITDGPAKEAGLGTVVRLGLYDQKLYFLDRTIGQLRRLEQGAVRTCEGGSFEGALDLACGAMDGACGGFRIFILTVEKILVYDPIEQSQSLLCEAPQGATAMALKGCTLFILGTEGLSALDLKTLELEPVQLESSPDMWRVGPAIEMNEEV